MIIGSGTAGLAALEALRRARPNDPVTMVSAEPEPPYSPTALPHLLAGRIDESRIALRPGEFFERMRCRLRLGMEATGVDPERRVVSFADGARVGFDTLLVAAGSEPLMPGVENPAGVEVLTFTRLADLRALRARLSGGCRVAILGAGLIGMELAEALVHLSPSIRVTLIEQESQVLPRTFSAGMTAQIHDLFEQRGVACRLGRRALAIEKSGSAAVLTLSDGSAQPSDLVVACVGVKPRMGFLADSGLACRRGVLVDRRMATSLPDIYAAGDLAEGPSADGEVGCHPVLPTAAAQGRVAGANMAGGSVEYEGWLPANAFNFFGRLAMSVGATDIAPGGAYVERANGSERGELRFEGDRLLGAAFIDMPADPGALSWLIRAGVPVRAHAELLLARPLEAGRWLASRAQRGAA